MALHSYTEPSTPCDCKIGRTSRKYEIDDIDEELGRRWLADDDQMSLRELSAYFNESILRTAMDDAGMAPLEGEVSNLYYLLTDDSVTAGNRTQARNQLEKHGIDPDEVQSDFVSYQTVNRHLKRCLELERRPTDGSSVEPETALDRIGALQSRTAKVTEKTLSRLQADRDRQPQDFEVILDTSVVCNNCYTQLTVEQVINGTECDCE